MLFTNRFAKQANVHISLSSKDPLPRVSGDPDQLKQVFLNLVTNAVQAMGDAGGEIEIVADGDDDYVIVKVRDTGPGIAFEDLTRCSTRSSRSARTERG